jgi:hypothetical protein
VAQLALKTSQSRSIWFRKRLQALCPSSESKSYFSSALYFKWSLIMTVFSNNKKSEDRRNSSISVRGRGGAVYALMGISLGNSNSSSLMYYAFLPFMLLLLKDKRYMVEDVLQIRSCVIVLTLPNQLLLLIRRYTYN